MTYKVRLLEEHTALADKITKLTSFIGTPGFADLHEVDRTLLRAQLSHMRHYIHVLEERMDRAQVEYTKVP